MAKGGSSGGLGGIADEAKSLAFDLGIPIAMLAAGASKVSVAWMAFANIWTRRVLGPMADFTGIAAGAISAIRRMAASFKDFGMGTASAMEKATVQFKPFLKGIESAKKRVEELGRVAADTPFSMESVIAASQQLENLTRGALSTGKSLEMVGDVAAMTGKDFETTSYWIGRLYDAIMSGRPIGEATMRLQEMGAVSGTTRNQLESLTEAGAAGNEVWKVAEKEFSRASGSMKDMSKTLQGLQSTLADNKNLMGAAFASGYMEGDKAMVEAMAKAYDKLTPVAKAYGEVLGKTSNLWNGAKAGVINYVTSIEALQPALKLAGAAMATFLVAVQGATALAGISWAVKWVRGMSAVTNSTIVAGNAFKSLGVAMSALMAGNVAGAKRFGLLAASKMKSAGAAVVLGQAAVGAGKGLKFLAAMAWTTTKALITTPLFAAVAAFTAIAGVMLVMANKAKEAREALSALNATIRSQTSLLDQQINAIRSASDAQLAYASATQQVIAAHAKLSQMEQSYATTNEDNLLPQIAQQRKLVEMLDRRRSVIAGINPKNLETPEGTEGPEQKMARKRQEEESMFAAKLEGMSPDQRVDALQQRADQQKAMADKANADDLRYQKERSYKGTTAQDRAALTEMLHSAVDTRTTASSELEGIKAQSRFNENQGASTTDDDKERMRQLDEMIRRSTDTIDAARTALSGLDSGPSIADVLASEDELARVNAAVQAIDGYSSALDGVSKAREKGDKEAVRSAKIAAGAALEEVSKAAKMAPELFTDQNGGALSDKAIKGGEFGAARKNLEAKRNDIAARNQAARDAALMSSLAAQSAARERGLSAVEATFEVAKAQAGTVQDNIASEEQILGILQNQLNVRKMLGQVSEADASVQQANIDAQREKLTQSLAERKKQAGYDLSRADIDAQPEGMNKKRAGFTQQRKEIGEAKNLTDEERASRLAEVGTAEANAERENNYTSQFASLDIDAAALELQDEGLSRALEMVEIEKKRLALKAEETQMNAEVKKAEEARLKAMENGLKKQADLLQKRAALETAAARAGQDMQRGLSSGSVNDVADAKRRKQAAEDQMASNDIKDQSRQMFADTPEEAKQRTAGAAMEAFAKADKALDEFTKSVTDAKGKINLTDGPGGTAEKYSRLEDERAAAKQAWGNAGYGDYHGNNGGAIKPDALNKRQQAYHNEQMKAREADRKKDEAAFTSKERRQAKINSMARRADILEAGGSTQQAAALRERQAKMEATDRARQRASDLVAGGMGQKEAVKLAKKERAQEGRARRAGNRAGGSVIDLRQFPDLRMTANSLSRIGGGGNAVGAGSYAAQVLKKMDTMIGIQRGTGAAVSGKMRMR